jgi:hypothetical protein
MLADIVVVSIGVIGLFITIKDLYNDKEYKKAFDLNYNKKNQ